MSGSYAREREYSPAQRVAVILEHLREIGPLTAVEAARLAGCGRARARCILNDIGGAVPLYKEGTRWIYLAQDGD